ncbi:hypothetical protein Btru_043178 [Bulinus truncatus]|nr:hypothetical protein Btru_043178 [Bulinus truncatus]
MRVPSGSVVSPSYEKGLRTRCGYHCAESSLSTSNHHDNQNTTENVDRPEKLSRKKIGKKKVRFNVRLQLPSSQINKLLNNEDDGQYQKLSEIITQDIQKMYADQPGELKMYNLQMSSRDTRNETSEPNNETPQKILKPQKQKDKKRRQKNILKKSRALLLEPLPVNSESNVDNMTSLDLRPRQDKKKKNGRLRQRLSGEGRRKWLRKNLRKTKANEVLTSEAWSSTATTATSKEASTTTTAVAAVTSVALQQAASDGKFNVLRLTDHFRNCMKPPMDSSIESVIMMDPYLTAYSELLGIFYFFGPIFKFAADDVKEKLDLLTTLRNRSLISNQGDYSSLQSMFAFEYSPDGAKVKKEGVRENKYLLRALKFIAAIVRHIRDPDTSRSMSSRAKEAYDMSLARYHEWYVKGAVYLALLTFPSREHTMSMMDVPKDQDGAYQLDELADAVTAVYDEMMKLYGRYSAET